MNILVLNGSPKGKFSTTVQTSFYLQKRYPKHDFEFLNIGQQIKLLTRDFSKAQDAFAKADLVLFSYPVYTFLAPYQVHRFVELMKEHQVDLSGKYVTQISTSKHFYDTTAHQYIEDNCYDFGGKFIRGLYADMDDLLQEKGQREADCYFAKVLFDIEHDIYSSKLPIVAPQKIPYFSSATAVEKIGDKDVVVVTNVADDDENLTHMIEDFVAVCPHPVRVINIRKFPFSGGCLGCFGCNVTAKCVYKDGFDDYLRGEIQNADAMVYAYTIENHYTEASFKCYDDRQFCNGHRTVTHGMPVGYLISGNYDGEQNVQTLVNARSEVGGVYLCGVATDERNVQQGIENLAQSMDYALTHQMEKPLNFYGVGGSKIFRDLVYLMQGMMKADHKYYKKHGNYDFPQNQKGKILQMKFFGALMNSKAGQTKMKGKINQYIVMPYTKLLESTTSADE